GFFGGKQPLAGEAVVAQTETAPPPAAPMPKDGEFNAPAKEKAEAQKLILEEKKQQDQNERTIQEADEAADKFDGGSLLSTGKSRGFERSNYDRKALDNLVQQRPGTKVQTGPGLPHWDWNRFSLQWNGPVEKAQTLHFFLISPALNLFLAVLRVLL